MERVPHLMLMQLLLVATVELESPLTLPQFQQRRVNIAFVAGISF
jgi:hypothetical protein